MFIAKVPTLVNVQVDMFRLVANRGCDTQRCNSLVYCSLIRSVHDKGDKCIENVVLVQE